SVSPRQSLSSLILASIRCEGESPPFSSFEPLFLLFMVVVAFSMVVVARPSHTPVVARSPDRATVPTEGLLFRGGSPSNRRKGHVHDLPPVGTIPRRRGPAPFLGKPNQSLAPRIVVQIIDLLLPKGLGLNRFGMPTRLPQATLPIRCGLCPQRLRETFG